VFVEFRINIFIFSILLGPRVFEQLQQHTHTHTSQWTISLYYDILPSAFHIDDKSFPHLLMTTTHSVNHQQQCR